MKNLMFAAGLTLLVAFGSVLKVARADRQLPSVTREPRTEQQNQQSESLKLRRHKITASVTSLDDVKVSQGMPVQKGQLLTDRTEQRLSLESQRDKLKGAIELMSQPMIKPAPLPQADFTKDEVNVAAAKAELEQLEQMPVQERRFTGELSTILDHKIIEDEAKLSEDRLKAEIKLQKALADLNEAKNDYAYQQYEHSLKMQQYQSNLQRQQYQLGQLMAQLQDVEDKLDRLAVVKAPVSGQIRRVKVTGQSDRQISVEITIDPNENTQES